MNESQEVKNLMAVANASRSNAESLWEIAARLEKIGENSKAAKVRQWAAAAERQRVTA
jgi:hypothetical protein